MIESSDARNSPDPPLLEHAIDAARIGALAGLSAAMLDVASTVLWLSSSEDQRRLVLVLALLGAGAGAVVAALVSLVFSSRVLRSAGGRALFTRALVVAAAPSVAVGHLLFTGGFMRRIALRPVLEPLAMLLVAALISAGITATVVVVRHVRAGTRAHRALAAGAFVALALALHAADHRFLPRLYEYLHGALGVATGVALAAAIAIVDRSVQRRSIARRAFALAPIGAAIGLWLMGRWDNVRAEIFGTHAPFVRHVALVLESLARPRRAIDQRALDGIARERAARDRAALAAERDPSLPRLAGAHVLLVTVDAMRADRLSPERTPALWALATEGVRFARAYAQAPHSSYSITSLHTGEFLHETVQLGQRQPLPTMASAFAAAGYRTVALYTQGIFFTEGERLTDYRDRRLDFQRSEHRDMDARATTDAASRELDESVSRGEPPTFLWAHYFDAHEPYRGEGASAEVRYDAAIRTVDREVARLVFHARARLHRPIIVALAADHGEEFGEHGGVYHGSALYEEQVRVPLVIHGPGVRAAVVESPVGLVDLAPTLLALAGVARPASMRGRDLRPRMIGRGEDRPDPVFSAVNTRTMVVRWPHKLVADLRWGVRELYDLQSDPRETRNRASDDRATLLALESELRGWLDALGGRSGAALVRMGDRSAVDGLIARALDEREPIATRVEAIEALGTLRDRSVIERLSAMERSSSAALRLSWAMGAGMIGDERARSVLREALGSSDDEQERSRVALALAALGDRSSTRALVSALRAGVEAERSAALDGITRVALGDRGSLIECEAALFEALEDDHLRYRAALAIGAALGSRGFSALVRVAREDRADDARAWAVAGLALSGDPRAEAVIAERLRADASAQRYAASAWMLVQAGRASGWDARRAQGECGRASDDEPWVALGARACRLRERWTVATIAMDVERGVRVMARGEGALVVRANGAEIMRFSLESQMREWRVERQRIASGQVTAECTAECWLAHVALVQPTQDAPRIR
jgi:arylsulfatase A-like enzyme